MYHILLNMIFDKALSTAKITAWQMQFTKPEVDLVFVTPDWQFIILRDTKMFLLILLLITFMQHYSLLLSRLTALLMHVILNEWLAILQHILNISWSGVLTPLIVFGCYMAGAACDSEWVTSHFTAYSEYQLKRCTYTANCIWLLHGWCCMWFWMSD